MSLTSVPIPIRSPSIAGALESCVPDSVRSVSSTASAEIDFSQRAQLEELMDQPCSYDQLRACLRDIAWVNRLTFAHRPTLSWLAKIVRSQKKRAGPLRIVDVGCGDGDTLRRIERWAAKRGILVELTGIDLNGDAIRAAKEATPASQKIVWKVGNALGGAMIADTDLVICSLLTHHLDDLQIVVFLRWMEGVTQRGWFINDLHRQPVPYHLFRLWARFARWHPFVKHDGPVSIRRSFVVADWQALCSAAEMNCESILIRTQRPARLCVSRIK